MISKIWWTGGSGRCRAMTSFMGPVTETPPEEMEKVLNINLMGPFILSKLILPGMIEKSWGRIINISSIAPRVNPPHSATYNISKAGLNSLTTSLSREVGASGISVNALAPGLVLTDRIKNSRIPGLAAASGKTEEEILESMTSRSDTKRLSTEDELAQTVLFLCSRAARNISGEIIEISGGF